MCQDREEGPKIKTPFRAVLRPRGRLNAWCAVDCACGGPGAFLCLAIPGPFFHCTATVRREVTVVQSLVHPCATARTRGPPLYPTDLPIVKRKHDFRYEKTYLVSERVRQFGISGIRCRF